MLRWKAGDALRNLAAESSIAELLPELHALLRHPEAEVRIAAAKTLGAAALDPVASETVTLLLALSHDTNPSVAATSLESLAAQAGNRRFLADCEPADRTHPPPEPAAARERRGSPGHLPGREAAPEALTRLLDLLQDSDSLVPSKACSALAQLRERAATPAALARLTHLVRQPNELVAGRAIETLCHLKDKAATPEVIASMLEILRDDHPQVSRAVYVAGPPGRARSHCRSAEPPDVAASGRLPARAGSRSDRTPRRGRRHTVRDHVARCEDGVPRFRQPAAPRPGRCTSIAAGRTQPADARRRDAAEFAEPPLVQGADAINQTC